MDSISYVCTYVDAVDEGMNTNSCIPTYVPTAYLDRYIVILIYI